MKVGIIVEGNDDADFLNEIRDKLGGKWKEMVYVYNMKGKIFNDKEIGKQINKLRNEYLCEKIVVLVDTDGQKKEKEKIVKGILDTLKEHEIIVAYANVCIESWILGCFDDIKNPENFKSSQEAKKELRRKTKGEKTFTLVIKHNEMKHFKRSKSFDVFIDKLNSLLNLKQNA